MHHTQLNFLWYPLPHAMRWTSRRATAHKKHT